MNTLTKVARAVVLLSLLVLLVQCGSGDLPAETPADAMPTAHITIYKEGPIPVDIHAEQKKIMGIRITVDDDLRRPYWVEQGNSKRFFIKDRIVIETGGTHEDPATGKPTIRVSPFVLSINGQPWADSTYRVIRKSKSPGSIRRNDR